MTIKERITKAVKAYTGKQPEDLQIHRDPKVSGVYAVRLKLKGDEAGFLFNKNEADEADDDWKVLEEVEFESWPPKSNESGAGSMNLVDWNVS